VRPWGSGGVYPNWPDPDLADWARAYHGENLDRLVEIKARYDPEGFFRFHQSVPDRVVSEDAPAWTPSGTSVDLRERLRRGQ
jgi:hypothetical protein